MEMVSFLLFSSLNSTDFFNYLGTYVWADGSTYKGSWEDNKISGHVGIYSKFKIIFVIKIILGCVHVGRWKKI
jgi:hypothetical protein